MWNESGQGIRGTYAYQIKSNRSAMQSNVPKNIARSLNTRTRWTIRVWRSTQPD